MYKRLFLFLLILIFFSKFNLVQADVIINEIQLSPTGERFLELYNTGDSSVDLTGWYMQRKTATGSSFGSLVSNPNFEGQTIGTHDYFVISRSSLSNSDIVLDSLTLTESNTIQIKNSDEEVIDKVGWGNASDCGNPCPPNPGEGKSIQKSSSGSWVSATPTPGSSNQASTSNDTTTNDTNTDSSIASDNSTSTSTSSANSSVGGSSSSSSSSKKTPIVSKTIKVQITTKTLAYVGIPLLFQGSGLGHQGEQLSHGRYFWNFGDGDFREVNVINVDKFTHTYFYEGEYTVLFEYYPDSFADVPDASDEIVIKVVTPGVFISSVGGAPDFFVELSNNKDYDVDISKWILASNTRSFKIPQNTIIGSKKKMIISSRLTNFSVSDRDTLKLSTSQGDLAFDYGAPVFPASKSFNLGATSKNKLISNISEQPVNGGNIEEAIFPNDLSASAISGETTGDDITKSYLPIIIFFVFIGISAGAVYFIRKKRINAIKSSNGSDFDILDE